MQGRICIFPNLWFNCLLTFSNSSVPVSDELKDNLAKMMSGSSGATQGDVRLLLLEILLSREMFVMHYIGSHYHA
jgi:hypothetical protein